jgi:hypothetical protein
VQQPKGGKHERARKEGGEEEAFEEVAAEASAAGAGKSALSVRIVVPMVPPSPNGLRRECCFTARPGDPRIDPEVLLRALLVGYLYGITSCDRCSHLKTVVASFRPMSLK